MAWAEPSHLPPGGGQAQLLVRAQRRDGSAAPGLEVRFRTSAGSLFSGGRVLETDSRGMTRDRVTTSRGCLVTVEVGQAVRDIRVGVDDRN